MSYPLPSVLIGLLTYNGVKFDALYTSDIQGEPVYDDAKRTIKFLRWAITVSARITPQGADSTTDPYLLTLRQKLTRPGQILQYQAKGFGDFIINNPAVGVWDVDWGPKPELLSFKPIGNNLAALVVWRCTVAIPECPTALFQRAVMMLNYSASWDIDTDGYHIINTSGALEIPLTYRSGNKVADNADNYRELAVPPVNLNFQRKQNFRLSADRRRLDFTITDTEMPVPLPVGTTLAQVKYKVHSNVGGVSGFVHWMHTLSGTFRVLPDRPKAEAFDKFFNIVAQKINNIIRSPDESPIRRPCLIMLTNFEMENDVFGKDSHFSISFVGMGYTLKTVLQVSGLFAPISNNFQVVGLPPVPPESDFSAYARWQLENQKMAGHIRGNIKARFGKIGDLLLDLCVSTSTAPTNPSSNITNIRGGGTPSKQTPDLLSPIRANLSGKGAAAAYGEEANSWLLYDCAVEYYEDDHVVRHKPLAGTLTTRTGGDDYSKLSASAARQKDGTESFGPKTDTPDRFQRLSAPSATLRLRGAAMRVGHQIAAPRILSLDGQKLVQATQAIIPRTIGAIQGIPIYLLTWDIIYLCPTVPSALPSVANPALWLDGQTGLAPDNDTELPILIRG